MNTFFYKSINALDKVHDAPYILKLMEDVINLVGEQNVVQVVTNNRPQYKAASELLMKMQPHIF